MVGKGKNAGNLPYTNFILSVTCIFSPEDAFNLDHSKNLSFSKKLNDAKMMISVSFGIGNIAGKDKLLNSVSNMLEIL